MPLPKLALRTLTIITALLTLTAAGCSRNIDDPITNVRIDDASNTENNLKILPEKTTTIVGTPTLKPKAIQQDTDPTIIANWHLLDSTDQPTKLLLSEERKLAPAQTEPEFYYVAEPSIPPGKYQLEITIKSDTAEETQTTKFEVANTKI